MGEMLLSRTSPLASVRPYKADGIAIAEAPDFAITQVAGFGKPFEKALATAMGKLPKSVGVAVAHDGRLLLRIAPEQFWIIGPVGDAIALPAECLVTPLTSARCRIALTGAKARQVLSRCAPIDFHHDAFKPDQFGMTGIHHTPVTIHCIRDDTFHIYALRTFAVSVWEWVVDAAQGLET